MKVEVIPDVSVGGALAPAQNDSCVELGGQCVVATILQPAGNNGPVDGSPHSNCMDLAPRVRCRFSNTFNLAG